MAVLWYYTSGGRQMEPVSTEQIQSLARDGRLKPTDMVWREGMPKWVRAGSAPELFPDPDALFEKALAAAPSTPAPAFSAPPAPAGPRAPAVEPILLDPVVETPPTPTAKKTRDEDNGPDQRRSRPPRRKRPRDHTTTLVILIAIGLAAGLLLTVLVLGMFFIAINAH